MNVTLVYPCIRNFGGFNSLGRNHEGCFILHGLPSIAACLEQRGHTVELLDLRERLSWNDAEAWLRKDNGDFYGIYMSTLDYYEARHVAQIIRKVRPKAKICVGGPHPSIDPEGLAKLGEFDFVFKGEGEITFPEMVENPEAFSQIVEGMHPDLNKLPYEKREIFNMKKVLATKHPVYPKPFINVISGRGCPFNCSFCLDGSTLVDGKPITEIKVGDTVLSQKGKTKVVKTFKREVNEILKITLEDGTELLCTEEHPVFTENGWVQAGSLGKGMKVLKRD